MPKKFKPKDVYIASGSAHPDLANDIVTYMHDELDLDVQLGGVETKRFPSGERYVRYTDSVRGKHVFAIQSHINLPEMDIHAGMWEHGMLVDAARRSSASEITAISPHFGYARQDRQVKGREAVGTGMMIDFLRHADRLVTVDIHSPQTQGIFFGPFDHLTAQPALEAAIEEDIAAFKDECVVVAPDAGAAKLAQKHERSMGLGILHMAKQRDRGDSSKIKREGNVPEANGRVCLIFDDMIDTAGTLITAVRALKDSGAKGVYVAASHGVFSKDALPNLKDAPIDKLYVTDTFPQRKAQEVLGDKLRVVSVAPIIGRAIMEIVKGGSVSAMFDDENHW